MAQVLRDVDVLAAQLARVCEHLERLEFAVTAAGERVAKSIEAHGDRQREALETVANIMNTATNYN